MMITVQTLNKAEQIVQSVMTKTMPTQINDTLISYKIKTDVSDIYPSIKIYWKIDMPVGESIVSHKFGMSMCVPEDLEKEEFICEWFTDNVQAKVDDLVMRFVKGILKNDLSDIVANDTPTYF